MLVRFYAVVVAASLFLASSANAGFFHRHGGCCDVAQAVVAKSLHRAAVVAMQLQAAAAAKSQSIHAADQSSAAVCMAC